MTTEDASYRTSTQYRLWSFTPELLSDLRAKTNASAAERVREALVRSKSDRSEDAAARVECLTVEEELKLVSYYCIKVMDLADFMKFPTAVKATAIQYLKRFYLSNSPMTYHPKSTLLSALFLATKTENHYIALKNFAEKIPKTTPEDVLATEFLVIQGLRFTFDVRHPLRGLEGGFMELLKLSSGQGNSIFPPKASSPDAETGSIGTELVEKMQQIALANGSPSQSQQTKVQLRRRIETTHDRAKELLSTAALLTDAYFMYTPAQIWMAALWAADAPLAQFYLDAKFSGLSLKTESSNGDGAGLKSRLISTVKECAGLLTKPGVSAKPSKDEMEELKRIDKKLFHCRNPDKIDLVGLNKAHKRDGVQSGDEKAAKKRKLAEQATNDDVFGGDLK